MRDNEITKEDLLAKMGELINQLKDEDVRAVGSHLMGVLSGYKLRSLVDERKSA